MRRFPLPPDDEPTAGQHARWAAWMAVLAVALCAVLEALS